MTAPPGHRPEQLLNHLFHGFERFEAAPSDHAEVRPLSLYPGLLRLGVPGDALTERWKRLPCPAAESKVRAESPWSSASKIIQITQAPGFLARLKLMLTSRVVASRCG
jgi:hypothetical protein